MQGEGEADSVLEGPQLGLWGHCGPAAITRNQAPKRVWEATPQQCRVRPCSAPGAGLSAAPRLSHSASVRLLQPEPSLAPSAKAVGSPGEGLQRPALP